MWEGGRDDKYRKEIREGRSENEQKALCTGIELSTSKFNRKKGGKTNRRTENRNIRECRLCTSNHEPQEAE